MGRVYQIPLIHVWTSLLIQFNVRYYAQMPHISTILSENPHKEHASCHMKI